VVLAGDARLPDKLRREDVVPLGSRIRTRLATEYATREELLSCLNHSLAGARNASLMTPGLHQTLCDHAPATTMNCRFGCESAFDKKGSCSLPKPNVRLQRGTSWHASLAICIASLDLNGSFC
jgi:hypothetical protein